MKRFVTLALMMLIGGYGAAQAQTENQNRMITEGEAAAREEATRQMMEQVTEVEEATNEFLGLEWGAGIGVMGGFGGDPGVEKVSIVDAGNSKIVHVEEEGDLRPQVFLEMHVFPVGQQVRAWREYQRWKEKDRMAQARGLARERSRDMPEPPLMGFGPFIALQSGDNEAIDALALGVMWGFRRKPEDTASLNLGIGLSFDPSVQVLGKGMKEGETLPNGETAVRLKKEGRFGWSLMASFTF